MINLAWNGLGADGGAAIGDAIGVNETLQEIDISGNRIDAHAAMSIAKGLRKNEDLLILRVRLCVVVLCPSNIYGHMRMGTDTETK